jgi:hypothetical protein
MRRRHDQPVGVLELHPGSCILLDVRACGRVPQHTDLAVVSDQGSLPENLRAGRESKHRSHVITHNGFVQNVASSDWRNLRGCVDGHMTIWAR